MSEQERRAFMLSGDLISITEAAQYTPYSAEYLSLRARTGNLKAIKIARNWLTTRGAVLSYLRAQQRKHNRAGQLGQVNSNVNVNSNFNRNRNRNTSRAAVYNLIEDRKTKGVNGSASGKSIGKTMDDSMGNDRKVVS